MPPLALTAAGGAAALGQWHGGAAPRCLSRRLGPARWRAVAHCRRRPPRWVTHHAIAHLSARGGAQGPPGGGRAPPGRSPASGRPPSAWWPGPVHNARADWAARLSSKRPPGLRAEAQMQAGRRLEGCSGQARSRAAVIKNTVICHAEPAAHRLGHARPASRPRWLVPLARSIKHPSEPSPPLEGTSEACAKALQHERYGWRQPGAPQPRSAIR